MNSSHITHVPLCVMTFHTHCIYLHSTCVGFPQMTDYYSILFLIFHCILQKFQHACPAYREGMSQYVAEKFLFSSDFR